MTDSDWPLAGHCLCLEHVVEFWSASLSRRRQRRQRRRAAWLAAAAMVSVAGPWPAVAAAAGGSGLASSDGTRQQRQLTRSVIVSRLV